MTPIAYVFMLRIHHVSSSCKQFINSIVKNQKSTCFLDTHAHSHFSVSPRQFIQVIAKAVHISSSCNSIAVTQILLFYETHAHSFFFGFTAAVHAHNCMQFFRTLTNNLSFCVIIIHPGSRQSCIYVFHTFCSWARDKSVAKIQTEKADKKLFCSNLLHLLLKTTIQIAKLLRLVRKIRRCPVVFRRERFVACPAKENRP